MDWEFTYLSGYEWVEGLKGDPSDWVDYSHLAPGSFLAPGTNRIFFGASSESDWGEHIVEVMRWNLYGWPP